MNFLELRKDIQSFIGDYSSNTEIQIGAEINDAITELLNSGMWKFAMRQTTITTTNGVADYYFPMDFDRMISFTQREDDIQMERVWIGDYERLVPNPSNPAAPGRPKYYMELLDDRVFAQPTAATIVTFVSDSDTDLTPRKASVYGLSSSGIDYREQVTLSAQNFVSSGGQYSKLYAITLNLSCVGTVAAYQEAVGTNLIKLFTGELERNYKKYKVYPVPDGTYTLYLTYQATNTKLVNDGDVPIIPSKYHGIVEDIVIGRFLLKQGDSKASFYLTKSQGAIREMITDEELLWDYVPNIRWPSGAFTNQNYPFVNR